MKRVFCLYRVSTKKQVDINGELTVQRNVCHDFASNQADWKIVKEFTEKGVSGYKVAFHDREGIQELKEAVRNGEIDVVLVYMFDRLGRREQERIDLTAWLIQHGIEVWSVNEGQQKLENIGDKIINVIRANSAEEESKKISLRVSAAKRELTMEGRYTGGTVPYGYQLVDSGFVNKKKHIVKELAINPAEAEIVRLIFSKYVNEGYGSFRLAQYLNARGILTHNGSKFQSNTINRIITNRLYTGYIISGDAVSPYRDDLKIIENGVFEQAQKIHRQRQHRNEEKNNIAFQTKGKTLLSGNIFCAHCGQRLRASSYIDHYYANGEKHSPRKQRYVCAGKVMKNGCDGQTGYVAAKIDSQVEQIVKEYLKKIKQTPKDQAIKQRYQKLLKEKNQQYHSLLKEESKMQERLKKLSIEVAKVLTGESQFSKEILTQAISNAEQELALQREKINKAEFQLSQMNSSVNNLDDYYNRFVSWADEFDHATMEQKKMICCQLLKEVNVSRGYHLDIVFNANYQQFLGETEEQNMVESEQESSPMLML